MKSLLSFLLFIALYSCQNEGKNSFKGIGELNIGSKFDSISSVFTFPQGQIAGQAHDGIGL